MRELDYLLDNPGPITGRSERAAGRILDGLRPRRLDRMTSCDPDRLCYLVRSVVRERFEGEAVVEDERMHELLQIEQAAITGRDAYREATGNASLTLQEALEDARDAEGDRKKAVRSLGMILSQGESPGKDVAALILEVAELVEDLDRQLGAAHQKIRDSERVDT